jgi:hypothetical protein
MRYLQRLKAGSIIELNGVGVLSVTSSNPAAITCTLASGVLTIAGLVAGQTSTLIQVTTDGAIIVKTVTVF